MVRRFDRKGGPGRTAPARFLFTAILFVAAPASAQAPRAFPMAAIGQETVPDSMTVAKLVWSTMAAADQANRTGNYSVLHDLGAPAFQAVNSVGSLAGIFQALRNAQIDLGFTLLVNPNYDFPPAIVQGGLLRIRGSFPLRPAQIGFDLLFQNVNGQWRVYGMAVAPLPAQRPAATTAGR